MIRIFFCNMIPISVLARVICCNLVMCTAIFTFIFYICTVCIVKKYIYSDFEQYCIISERVLQNLLLAPSA